MNGRTAKKSFKEILMGGGIMDYLQYMRRCSYYKHQEGITAKILFFYNYWMFRKLAVKYGFSIGYDVFGYGLVIPHYGTIVVGPSNRIGNFAVLHTSTCITDNNKQIGNALYLSSGAKITSKIILGDNVTIGANAVVNKSFIEGNCLLVGVPCLKKKDEDAWYIKDGEKFRNRVSIVEKYKNYNLQEYEK